MLDGSAEIDRLKRIVALLLALAGLAERAAAVSRPVRRVVLCILRRAEAVARPFVAGLALALRLRRRSVAPPSVLPDISPSRGEIGCREGLRQPLKEGRDGKAANLPPRGGDGRQARGGREGAPTPNAPAMVGPASPAGCSIATPMPLDLRDDPEGALRLAVRFRALALVLACLVAAICRFGGARRAPRAEKPRPAGAASAAVALRAQARGPPRMPAPAVLTNRSPSRQTFAHEG